MDSTLFAIIRLVHFVGMALWLGGGLIAPIGAGPDQATMDRFKRASPWIIGGAVLTVLSGMGLILAAGGLEKLPWRIWAGAAISIAIFLIGAVATKPAMNRVEEELRERGGEPAKFFPRMMTLLHVESALRLLVLLLMVLRF